MLSKELESTIELAVRFAQEANHEFVTIEHLFLALLENSSALEVLTAVDADVEELAINLSEHLDKNVPLLAEGSESGTQPSIGFQRVIKRAVLHSQNSGGKVVEGSNVLISIFSETESHAVFFLSEQDITRFDAVSYVAHGVRKTEGEYDGAEIAFDRDGEEVT